MSESSSQPPQSLNQKHWQCYLDSLEMTRVCIMQWKQYFSLEEPIISTMLDQLAAMSELAQHAKLHNQPITVVSGLLPLQALETSGVRGLRAALQMQSLLQHLRDSRQIPEDLADRLEQDWNRRFELVRKCLDEEQLNAEEILSSVSKQQVQLPGMEPPATPAASTRVTAGDTGTASAAESSSDTDSAPFSSAAQQGQRKQPAAGKPAAPRRPMLEILLDPRSIQALILIGASLITIGLVILLWINEYLQPPLIAVLLASGNTAILAAGLLTIRYTKYHISGRALALLACLIMPLNLWYCHAQDLVTVDGNLWLLAVIISLLYGVSAWQLKNEMFVYVFNAGVTMTGLLFVASMNPSPLRLQEIATPASLLIALGLIGIHLIRAFAPDTESPESPGAFSRQRFGMAFFWSGHIQIAAGLLLVLGAQIAGDWCYHLGFAPIYARFNAVPSPICGELRWLALLLVSLGVYAWAYSDLTVRRRGIFLQLAAYGIVWAQLIVVQMLDLTLSLDLIIAVLAGTSLVSHLAVAAIGRNKDTSGSFPLIGLLMGILPVIIGAFSFAQHLSFPAIWVGTPPQLSFIGAMLFTTVACRTGAWLSRSEDSRVSSSYLFATATATMIAAVSLLVLLGFDNWESHAPLLMLVPLAWLAASALYSNTPTGVSLYRVAHFATAAMLAPSTVIILQSVLRTQSYAVSTSATSSLFFAETAIFYGAAFAIRNQLACARLSTISWCVALVQLLNSWGFEEQGMMLGFAVFGLLMLLISRASNSGMIPPAIGRILQPSANGVLGVSMLSAFFRNLFLKIQIVNTQSVPAATLVLFSCSFVMISVLASLLAGSSPLRRLFVVSMTAHAVVTTFLLYFYIDLSFWQKLELLSVVTGLFVLGSGLAGWYHEQEEESESVSAALSLGSLLLVAPLAIATILNRSAGDFLILEELGFLFAGVTLLSTGVLLKLRACTLIGGIGAVWYFVSLAVLVPWGQLNTVAIATIIGGGLLFGTGLVLAFFRDRLLAIPEKFQKKEGIFRVLTWR